MGRFSDVTLSAEEGYQFHVNKIVLAAHSEFFTALFSDMFDSEGQQVFQLAGVTRAGLEQCLHYMYSRPLLLTWDNVSLVVKDADFMLLPDVVNKCSTFLSTILIPDNVLSVLELAKLYNLSNLQAECEEVILGNISVVGRTPDFLFLDPRLLVRLLTDDRLVVEEEGEVWRVLLLWLEANPVVRKQEGLVVELLAAVRFGLMDHLYFLQSVSSDPLLSSTDLGEEVSRYMNIVRSPKQSLESSFLHFYKSTPQFARPRFPSQFLFIIGGFTTNATVTDTIEVYDCRSDRWTQLSLNLPDSLVWPSAETLGPNVLVTGAMMTQPGPTFTASVSRQCWDIDLEQLTITKSVPMKEKRILVSTAKHGSTIYAIGGISSPYPTSGMRACEKLDLTRQPPSWERIPQMDQGRAGAGAVCLGDQVYVVGGFDGQSYLSSVRVFCTRSGRWRRGPEMSTGRSGVSCAVLGGEIFAAGGTDGVLELMLVEKLNPAEGRWEMVADMVSPRSFFCLAVVDGKLFAVGGIDGVQFRSCVERYDPDTDQWGKVESLPVGKADMACAVVDRVDLGLEAQMRFAYSRKGDLFKENLDRSMATNTSCICQNLLPDPLMLQCHYCEYLQHAACYRILHKDQVPAEHCCVSCSQQLNIPCTDPKLVKMSTKPASALTCVFRRILVSMRGTDDLISQDFLCSKFGVSGETADQILVKLERENCILSSEGGDGIYCVNNPTLETVAMPKYLGVKLAVPASVEGVVQQTEKTDISESSGKQDRGESEVQVDGKRSKDDGGQKEGRKSKRSK